MTGWQRLPLRRLGHIVGGGTPGPDQANWNGDVPFVTPPDLRDVVGRAIVQTGRTLTPEGARSGSAVVPADSVILSIRAPIGYVATTVGPVAFNQGCRALVPFEGVHAQFLSYALMAEGSELEAIGRGTTFLEVSAAQMAAFKIDVPSYRQQRDIADYLDRETAQIDALIDKQEQLIATLRERRAAAFSHRIGAISRHNLPLRRIVSRLRQGWSPNCDAFAGDPYTEWCVLKVGCSNSGSFDPRQNKRLPVSELPRPAHVVEPGEVVLSRSNTSDLVGMTAVVNDTYPRLMLSDLTYGLRLVSDVVPEYVSLALRTHRARAQITAAAKGTSPSMQKISQRDVLDINIPLPSAEVQRAVSDELTARSEKIDTLIAKAERFIELSKERRAALITAAVTGQLEIPA